MKTEPTILIGGGGHCRVIIEIMELGGWNIAGVVDSASKTDVCGYSYLGDDNMLPELKATYNQALVTVGQIKSAANRKRLYTYLKSLNYALPSLVSPLAHFSHRANLGEGSVVMHQALVNAGAQVGHNCIINSRALVEHDSIIGDHCHISIGAIVAGGTKIDDEVFMGMGSLCRNGIAIGKGCVVGMGVKVMHDLPPGTVYTGEK